MMLNATKNQKLRWEVNAENGCITKLLLSDFEINLYGWGCEVGNWYSFFSQDKLGGYKVKILDKKIDITEKQIKSLFMIKLQNGSFKLILVDRINNLKIERNYVLEVLEDSYLGDFAIRAVFDKYMVTQIEIANQSFIHKNLNLYHQFKTEKVILKTNFGKIKLDISKIAVPFSLGLVTYVRDEPPDKWVIHHRLLSRPENRAFLQCYKFILSEKMFPLLKWQWFKKHFLLFSELKFSKLPFTFQVITNAVLRSGERLVIDSSLEFFEKQIYEKF